MDPIPGAVVDAPGVTRDRQIRYGQVSGVVSRLTAIPCAAVSVAITTRYLGADLYGVLATILSFTALAQFADLGLGNGLLTALARARTSARAHVQRQLVTTAAVLLTAAGVAAGVMALVLSFTLPWTTYLGAPRGTAPGELRSAVLAYALILAVAIPASLGLQMAAALQVSHIANLWSIATAIMGAGAVALVVWLGLGLPAIVVAWAAPPTLVGVATTVILLRRHAELRPARRALSGLTARHLVGTGSAYFVLQAVSSLAFASDSLVIANVLDSAAVASYNVPAKLFAMVTALAAALTAPLWGSFASAFEAGDRAWVRRAMLRNLCRVATLAVVASTVLLVAGGPLISAWTGDAITADTSTLVSLACWTVVFAVGAQISTILNAAQRLRLQVGLGVGMLAVNLPLSVALTRSWGVAGAVWGSVISYSTIVLLPYGVLVWRLIGGRSLDASSTPAR